MKTNVDSRSNDYRDHIATADKSGHRIWVYPVAPKGTKTNARTIVAVFLLIFLFAAPFIRVDGQPFILLDILARNFIIFGIIFSPQDFYLFVLLVLTVLVFVVLFTAIFGRIFCGWVCPQTIFLEIVFRRVERWIEGKPSKQRALREGPWTSEKIFKWGLKQSVFFIMSFIICNTFLAYIIGTDPLITIMTDPPSQHYVGLSAMIGFTMLFYGVFAWFREQACTIVCPYGRLQGAIIEKNSIVVAYDYNRGEPRYKSQLHQQQDNYGDCIDCRRCVSVCPTGIDIRNGTQMECVNCAVCIDVCNSVMKKVGRPEGLIRYTSENKLEGKKKSRISGNIVIYSVFLTMLISVLFWQMTSRTDIEATIFRTPGTLYFETDEGHIRNLYSFKIVSKSREPIPLSLSIKYPPGGTIAMVNGDPIIGPGEIVETAFFLDFPREKLLTASTFITIEIIGENKILKEIITSFAGPPMGAKHE